MVGSSSHVLGIFSRLRNCIMLKINEYDSKKISFCSKYKIVYTNITVPTESKKGDWRRVRKLRETSRRQVKQTHESREWELFPSCTTLLSYFTKMGLNHYFRYLRDLNYFFVHFIRRETRRNTKNYNIRRILKNIEKTMKKSVKCVIIRKESYFLWVRVTTLSLLDARK